MPTITPFLPEHAPAVARLHRQCISAGFLSNLGEPFLARLYTAVSQDEQSVVLVALRHPPEHLSLLGFVSGTLSTSAMYRRILRKHWLGFSLTLLPRLLSPSRIAKALETLRYGRQEPSTSRSRSTSTSTAQSAELLSIAVNPAARGKGIGRELVAAFERALPAPGHRVVTSSSDPASNAFYRSCGFTLSRQFLHHGNTMNEYAKSASP